MDQIRGAINELDQEEPSDSKLQAQQEEIQKLQQMIEKQTKDLINIQLQTQRLSGLERTYVILNNGTKLQYDNQRLNFNNMVYSFKKIYTLQSLEQDTSFMPLENTLIIQKGNLEVSDEVTLQLLKFIFMQPGIEQCSFNLSGSRGKFDIFDQQNVLSMYQTKTNLMQIPIRNYQHCEQVLEQLNFNQLNYYEIVLEKTVFEKDGKVQGRVQYIFTDKNKQEVDLVQIFDGEYYTFTVAALNDEDLNEVEETIQQIL